jgi:cyanoexosortase B
MQNTKQLPLKLIENKFEYLIIGLLAILYAPILIHWYDGWLNKTISIEHEYFTHALIGFPFAIYISWLNRKKWQRLPNVSHPMGLVLLTIGGLFYLTGVSEFVYLSFPIILAGICLWLKGFAGFKLQGFSLILVLLATPNSVPYLLTPYTLPLQKFIAAISGFILMILGFDVTVNNIYISVDGRLVEVAPYCAGLKMLFTSIYVSLMLLYWTDNLDNRRRCVLLVVGSVIISVTANIFRNAILAFFHGTDQKAMFDLVHEGWGGDLYSAIMLGVIVLYLKFLERWNFPNQEKIDIVSNNKEIEEDFGIKF